MANDKDVTLVTGGSGYVAGWIIARLLGEGSAVRATLRDMARADAVRADIASVARDMALLEFVAADLLADGGWEAAMQGVRRVAHVAAPVMARRGVDTIATAVDGTQRMLRAAARAGVERIVLTSSAAAARSGDLSRPADETDWTDVKAPGVDTYTLSKTLAERAAWDFASAHPDGPQIATVLPGFVQGPLIGRNASESLGVVGQMLTGKMPAVPRLGFSMIDVCDLADLHLSVLNDPKGMGERWIASADFCGSQMSPPSYANGSARRRRKSRRAPCRIGWSASSHSPTPICDRCCPISANVARSPRRRPAAFLIGIRERHVRP